MSKSSSAATTAAPPTKLEHYGPEITFMMGLFRGLSALGLALLLFIVPEKSGSMLANKMGFFWLFSGIAMLRLNRNDPTLKIMGKKTSMMIAAIGIIAGLLMITRRLTEQIAPEAAFVTLLGVVIMLTGLIHLWSEFRVGGAASQSHRVLHALLGIFELIFGLMLVISPLDQSQFTYSIVTIWSLFFGILAIGEAVSQWMVARKEHNNAADDANPKG